MGGQKAGGGRIWNLYKQGGITPAIASAFGDPNAQQMAFIRSVMKVQRKQNVLNMSLRDMDYVVFDLETTGFRPNQGDEILSFGAVAVTGGELIENETFYSLVNPGREIPQAIQGLTGITQAEADRAPELIDVLHGFLDFVQRRVLIAHGTGHDKQFLNAALWKTSRVTLTHRVLDTMMIAKWLNPKRQHYELDGLLQQYGIPITTRHHALEDSVMTAKLWSRFLDEMSDRNVFTLGDLYAYLSG